ncbi:MAG: electron transfer flavoprotein subunit beta, partial [Actinobacteria bacterium]|nr:electron transfer flavoprotein subunit beta [Actinomycetota bacterium]
LGLGAELVGAAGSRTRVLAVGDPPSRAPAQLVKDSPDPAGTIFDFLDQRGLV